MSVGFSDIELSGRKLRSLIKTIVGLTALIGGGAWLYFVYYDSGQGWRGLINLALWSAPVAPVMIIGLILALPSGGSSGRHGTAQWAAKRDLRKGGLLGSTGFIIGKDRGKFLRFNEESHLFTFAPTGAGKGVSQVIPNLLDHPGSLVCTDIKGENYAITHRRRAAFGRVLAFDPFNLQTSSSAAFNPISFVRLGTPYARDDAKMLAQMIIPDHDGSKDRFFTSAAQNLLTGLILYVATSQLPEHANLITVRRLLTADTADFDLVLQDMKASGNPHLVEVANRYAAMRADDGKLAQNIITTAVEYTDFLASDATAAVLSRSDFHPEDLKRDVVSLFLIIPPDQLSVYYQLLRLVIGCCCNALSRVPGQPAAPVLFLLDEFPALRRMEPIEKAIAYARGYGARFWLFVQDLNQLRGTYGDWARSLAANCRCKSAFGVADIETAREVCAMMGRQTVSSVTTSKGGGIKKVTNTTSSSETARDLLTPDEIMRLPKDEQILLIAGMLPVRAKKVTYYKDRAFAGLFDRWG